MSLFYSDTFSLGIHLYITILLGLSQPTAFAANLLQYRGGSRNPTTFKMELFATIVNSEKLLTIITKGSWICLWQLVITIVEKSAVSLV